MTPCNGPRWDNDGAFEHRQLPIDPDLELIDESAGGLLGPFERPRRSRWPQIHWRTVLAIAVGGFLGGLLRYAVGRAWPAAPDAVPWGTFGVNTAGAFVLALLLMLVLEVLPPTTYVRPLVATGFCGALTTFSSVVTEVDEFIAHGHTQLAIEYLAGSVLAGLAAAALGLVLGRSIAASRERGRG